MAINVPVPSAVSFSVRFPIASDIPHCRQLAFSRINLSSRTPGAALRPDGPREDFLQTVRVRLLEVYGPAAERLELRMQLSFFKVKSALMFRIELKAAGRMKDQNFVDSLLRPLAAKLNPTYRLNEEEGTLAGIFCRQNLAAGLVKGRNAITILGTLTND